MRSFSILSIAATVAFSVFTSAAPLVGVDAGLAADAKVDVRRDLLDVGADVAAKAGIAVRDDGLASIPKILNDLTTDLSGVIDELNSITGANATNATIGPLLDQVVDIVGTAVDDVKKLVGAPLSTILASVDGTAQATVADVAKLLSKVLSLVVNALGAVLKTLGGDLSIIGTVLAAVGKILSDLLSAVLGLVDGLLGELLPLIGDLVPTLTTLAFSTVGSVLNLNLAL